MSAARRPTLGYPWSTDERAQLARMITEEGKTDPECALAMGRSVDAVIGQRLKMGIKRPNARVRIAHPERDDPFNKFALNGRIPARPGDAYAAQVACSLHLLDGIRAGYSVSKDANTPTGLPCFVEDDEEAA